ncbi:hypothetical protein D3C78_1909630 [compost metagenome]
MVPPLNPEPSYMTQMSFSDAEYAGARYMLSCSSISYAAISAQDRAKHYAIPIRRSRNHGDSWFSASPLPEALSV